MAIVAVRELREYDRDKVQAALLSALELCGAQGLIKPGMRVFIKPNLLMRKKPESACTTHPEIVRAVIRYVKECGAEAIVGDSPGGPYGSVYLRPVLEGTGIAAVCKEEGAQINDDYGISEAEYPDGLALRKLMVVNAALKCDMIINVCKLKTHGMMAYTGAVKNMFGIIPGTHKAEMHARFTAVKAFSQALVDIERFIRPAISVMDAVVGMEGDGPSAGDPREIGVLLASRDAHALDSVAASLIGLNADDVPTLARAREMGLLSDIETKGDDPGRFVVPDFKTLEISYNDGLIRARGLFGKLLPFLRSKPVINKEQCAACGDCVRSCPTKAMKMKNGKPTIDISKCVRCFCCQELCPKKAVTIKKPLIRRMLK